MVASIYIKICCCIKFKKTDQIFNTNIGKLYKIYKHGCVKMDKDLNIMNVMQKLRFFQISIISHINQEAIWKNYYDDYNIIDLDKSQISFSEDSDHLQIQKKLKLEHNNRATN